MKYDRTELVELSIDDRGVENVHQSSVVRDRRVNIILLISICTMSLILLICFADIRNMSGRLEKISSNEDNNIKRLEYYNHTVEAIGAALGRIANEDKEVDGLEDRIHTVEAISEALRRFAHGNESVESLPIGTGKVDWILDNYTSRVGDANQKQGHTVTIEGPSFYTKGIIGYNLGIRYHTFASSVLSTDQLINRYFVSIRSLEGVYDKLLKWPVAGNVTITFVDQSVPSTDSVSVHHSFTNEESDPCRQTWGHTFGEQHHSKVCRFELLAYHSLERTHLIYNDSLYIQVEVETK